MALPYLIKHVYTHGTDEVVRRAKKIHAFGYVELIEYDNFFSTATLRIKDDNYATFYKVTVQKINDPQHVFLRCTCPYSVGNICRHEAAALFQLQDLFDKGLLKTVEKKHDQRHTVAKMKHIDSKLIRLLSSQTNYQEAEKYLRTQRPEIEKVKNETVKASVIIEGEKYFVIIKRNEEKYFDTSSNFIDEQYPLCLPKIIVFLQLLNMYGPHYFDSIQNRDKEKNKLLEAYGYCLQDDLQGRFEFSYIKGKPYLRVLNSEIKRTVTTITQPVQFEKFEETQADISIVATSVVKETEKKIGVVLNFNKATYPYFTVDAICGEADGETNLFIGKVEKLDLAKYIESKIFSDNDIQLLAALRKVQESEIGKFISRNSPFSGMWENLIHHEKNDLPDETRVLAREYLYPRLKKLVAEFDSALLFQLPQGKQFKTANLISLRAESDELIPSFDITRNNGVVQIGVKIKAKGMSYGLSENESDSTLFFIYNHQLFFWKDLNVLELIEQFESNGEKQIAIAEWSKALQQEVVPLTKLYKVNFDKTFLEKSITGKPESRVWIKEQNDYLLFEPTFIYDGHEVDAKDGGEIIIPVGDKVLIIQRNNAEEQALVNKVQNLHSNFIYQQETKSLAIRGTEVLKNNWFFLFVDAMKEMKIPVYGFDALKNFRFNTARPSTNIFISSNTDWFDAKVNILFGDQQVSVADVKQALTNKQKFVQLGDGTLGILPEEWLKKYALLFRMSEGKTDRLKLSRYHLSVIDELYENRDENELTIQLEEKHEKIKNFFTINPIEPPNGLNNILRPYQISGYQWINYLSEIKWGGILADDMGLGKTVQALSFFQQYKNEKGKLQALVVCPTTLIYNWGNEIKKFTPNLSFHIHHGGTRIKKAEKLTDCDILITTYGTLRSDIKLLMAIEFDYIVLDESQSIKNPSSKVTKAASLLKAKHRLCMSGTPLQNNTFDIYAQMNFLNPGMLGSMEFFRQEFAIPIDKLGEVESKEHLRRIVYPFILRRTKEQVAKDLPEKTETILECEMESEQRKIYDAYRNDFRAKILGVIEEQGVQKSQLNILQGLMKLRQICDSPAILNEQDRFENHSIKLEELSREITENISNHKALIFSQFLGMLALIKERLTVLGVKYEYFDGSTSAIDREIAIQNFQNDDSVRIFLISLKAGGVGLNLTAADYVYIVDPWWNPAVEQQAIDRTHRIGQEKNVFAYRMICKNTIEDKIMLLQERKKNLAKELITDETSFVKALTKEDVEYLFS